MEGKVAGRSGARMDTWRAFSPQSRREVGTVVFSTIQSQSTSALFLLLLTILALQLSGTAASAPLVVAAGAIPPLVFVRPVRAVNRRLDERWVMILADVGALAVAFMLWLLVVTDSAALWNVYAGMFLFSTFGAFYLPAMREWAANRTEGIEQLTWLNAILASATQASVVIGWALGGVLLASLGVAVSLAICVVAYLLGICVQFVVFVVLGGARLKRVDAGGQRHPDVHHEATPSTWREMYSPRRLGLYTGALLLMGLTHTLAFSMFIPLVTGGDEDRSWVAGVANASFALMAVVSGLAVAGGTVGHYARRFVPQVVIVGCLVQIVFGLQADETAWAIGLFALVGLLSGGASALQSEVQERWRPVGSAQAFAVFGAVQGPLQLVGALALAALLTTLAVSILYVAVILILGIGSGVLLAVARRRTPGLVVPVAHEVARER